MMVVIDASVWVAADRADEAAREVAAAFLGAVLGAGMLVHQPTLTLVEVTSAIARRTHDAELAREAGAALVEVPGVTFHDLGLASAAAASDVAAEAFLRCADAVYAACAIATGSTLVTLDEELIERAPPGLDVTTPMAWLERDEGRLR